MSPSQDRPAFVIPSTAWDLTRIEDALTACISSSTQEERASAVGLKGHGQISRREQKLVTGEVDTYLEAYPSHYLLRVARSSPALAQAVIAFLSDSEATVSDESVERDLSAFAQRAAHELSEILSALQDQKITRIEATQRDTALQMLQEQIHKVRIKLGKISRGAK